MLSDLDGTTWGMSNKDKLPNPDLGFWGGFFFNKKSKHPFHIWWFSRRMTFNFFPRDSCKRTLEKNPVFFSIFLLGDLHMGYYFCGSWAPGVD